MYRQYALKLLATVMTLFLGASISQAEQIDFAQLEPILRDRCIPCHSGPNPPFGLRLDSQDNLLKGSSNGPVVIAGKPGVSELILRLKGTKPPRMPMTGPPFLSDQEIAEFEQWILAGIPVAATESSAPQVTSRLHFPEGKTTVTFTDILPILGSRCVKCHTEQGMMGPAPEGYRLTSYDKVLSCVDRVRVVPYHPEASELVRRIKGLAKPRMPFDGPPYLAEDEIATIESWVRHGALSAENLPAQYPLGARVRLHGNLTGEWQLEDGLKLILDSSSRIDKSLRRGDYVEVRGQVGENGAILVERLRRR